MSTRAAASSGRPAHEEPHRRRRSSPVGTAGRRQGAEARSGARGERITGPLRTRIAVTDTLRVPGVQRKPGLQRLPDATNSHRRRMALGHTPSTMSGMDKNPGASAL